MKALKSKTIGTLAFVATGSEDNALLAAEKEKINTRVTTCKKLCT